MDNKSKLSIYRKKALGIELTDDEKREYNRYMTSWNRRNYQTPKMRARALVTSARNSAKKKNLPFNLTNEWVEKKIVAGKCEVSGLDFDLSSMNTGKYGAGSQNPFAPSLDRTFPEHGYTTDNVKVVVWIYNSGKQNHSHETVMKLARALVEREA